MILFCDDIESQFKESGEGFYPITAELPLYLVDLYNQGLINCVFSVSDYRAISMLKSLTSHSTRFRCEEFPYIEDAQLQKDLENLSFEIQASQDDPFYWSWHFHDKVKQYGTQPAPDDKKRVLDNDDDPVKLVDSLGSQIGSLIATLRLVLFDRKSVDNAINSIIREEIPVVTSALNGELIDNVNLNIDQNLFICVTWKVFEKLSNSPERSIKWVSLKEDFPSLRSIEIKRVINHLVSLNLLYYSSLGDNIGFQRKVLKKAFIHLKDSAPHLLEEEREASKVLMKNRNIE